MATSIHKKLSGRLVPPFEMADILERHIGEGTDPDLCREASDALRRIHRDTSNFYVRAALKTLERPSEPCVCVRKAIAALRRWRYVSGA